jgi:hypothetical protein
MLDFLFDLLFETAGGMFEEFTMNALFESFRSRKRKDAPSNSNLGLI